MAGFRENLSRTFEYLKRNGLADTYYAARERLSDDKEGYSYEAPSEEDLKAQREWYEVHEADAPLISIIVPAYNTPERFFTEMARSVLDQSYPKLELVIADASEEDVPAGDAGAGADVVTRLGKLCEELSDERIRYVRLVENGGISANTNAGVEAASGDYIAFLDHDDLLTPDALYHVARAIVEYVESAEKAKADGPEMLYSDEDKCSANGDDFRDVHRKTDYDPELLLSNNYICHLSVARADVARKVAFRPEFDGAQDYDWALRMSLVCEKEPVHVPRVLYHWRSHEESTAARPGSKSYAYDAGRRALESFAEAKGWNARVYDIKHVGFYEMRYASDPFEFRPELGAIGGRIVDKVRGGHIVGGAIGEDGSFVYAGLPSQYSGGRQHRAQLSQRPYALDIRCIRIRPELADAFEEIIGVPYSETRIPGTLSFVPGEESRPPEKEYERVFDYRNIVPCASWEDPGIRLCEEIRKRGYTISYYPEWQVVDAR